MVFVIYTMVRADKSVVICGIIISSIIIFLNEKIKVFIFLKRGRKICIEIIRKL